MIVLDTHVLIWAVQDDAKLGREAAALIEATGEESGLRIPAICVWEAALVARRGTVVFAGGVLDWFDRILARPSFAMVSLDPEIAFESVMMDWSHKDPADRMIVATAQCLGAPLLTADRVILAYAAAGHVEAIDARV